MTPPTVSFPDRLDVARLQTPIVPLERYSARFGGPKIWIKRDDQTGAALSGNKIRKLQYTVCEAIASGADTLVTCGGVQSNHCRTTAALAARLGLQAHLVLRGEDCQPPQANLLLGKLFGATCQFVTPEAYANKEALLPEVAQRLRDEGRRPFVIAEGCSMPSGCWGYIEAVQEIRSAQVQLGVEFDALVCAVGSGGTHAGLELGVRLHRMNARVLGFAVCDDTATFRSFIATLCAQTAHKYALEVDVPPASLWLDDSYVGRGYGESQPAELACLVELARIEGIVLDPVYGAKAFFGLTRELELGRLADLENILYLHTGGIFGLLPYAAELPLG